MILTRESVLLLRTGVIHHAPSQEPESIPGRDESRPYESVGIMQKLDTQS